jgi:hypothetical protein
MRLAVDRLPTPPAEMRRLLAAMGALLVLQSERVAAQDPGSAGSPVPPAAAALPAPLTPLLDAGAGPAGDTLTPKTCSS